MRINSDIFSFKRATYWTVSSWGEVPLVDIFFVWDPVMMGSRCGGSLDYFLLAIFWSLEIVGSERNGVQLTKWKHNTKIKLVYALAI